ncbi:hypothetical protein ACFSDG_02875 [Pseudarcicella hirudinis]|nr:hypothetical protein [Pseudarcicella hirudinis]
MDIQRSSALQCILERMSDDTKNNDGVLPSGFSELSGTGESCSPKQVG